MMFRKKMSEVGVAKVKIDLLALKIEHLDHVEKIEAIKTLQQTLSMVCKNFDSSVLESLGETSSKKVNSIQITSKYFCHLCSLDIGKSEKYRKHMMKHSGKFKCNDCGKSFQDGYGLRRHLNNQFSCLDIKRENRKNTKLDFPCRFCRYRNEQKEEVKKHTMEKHGHQLIELKCPKCNYQYYRSSDFRKHAQKCHEKSQS